MWWKVIILWQYFRWRLLHFILHLLGVGIAIKHEGIYGEDSGALRVDYYHGTEKYKILIPVKRGVSRHRFYFYGEDVTSSLKAELGVSKNFHSIPTTPRMLGYPHLRVVNKGVETFHNIDDPIVL